MIKIVNSDKKEIKKKPKNVNVAIIIGEYGNGFLTSAGYDALTNIGFKSSEITTLPIIKGDDFWGIVYMLKDIFDEYNDDEKFVFIFTNSAFRVSTGKKIEKMLKDFGEIVFYMQDVG